MTMLCPSVRTQHLYTRSITLTHHRYTLYRDTDATCVRLWLRLDLGDARRVGAFAPCFAGESVRAGEAAGRLGVVAVALSAPPIDAVSV